MGIVKFWEAMKALEEGNKVRACAWAHQDWIDIGGFSRGYPLDDLDFKSCLMDFPNWELYEESQKMLSFAEVVKGLKEGKKFRRIAWKNPYDHVGSTSCTYFPSQKRINNQYGELCPLWLEDFEATDWIEVI